MKYSVQTFEQAKAIIREALPVYAKAFQDVKWYLPFYTILGRLDAKKVDSGLCFYLRVKATDRYIESLLTEVLSRVGKEKEYGTPSQFWFTPPEECLTRKEIRNALALRHEALQDIFAELETYKKEQYPSYENIR